MATEVFSSINAPGIISRSPAPFTAIDPGISYFGAAEFDPFGKLTGAGYYVGNRIPLDLRGGLGVIEKPVVYPRQTRNARTVAELSFAAGVLLGQFTVRMYVEPRTWKGTVDGLVFLRRTQRFAERTGDWELIEGCLSGVPKRCWEHVLDAYALGKWCLGVLV